MDNNATAAPDTGIQVISVDAELESQVWNAPRPETSNIELDTTKTAEVRYFFV